MRILDADYIVVGSGLAGLSAALKLSTKGRVLVVSKKDSSETNTSYAQGGIACVMSSGDSFDKHIEDTLVAGAGLCDPKVVEAIVQRAPAGIAALEAMGLQFSRGDNGDDTHYDLGKEGGHSARRLRRPRRRALAVGSVSGPRASPLRPPGRAAAGRRRPARPGVGRVPRARGREAPRRDRLKRPA